MHVSDATFVVTDTETTGTKAETNRIIELGAVKVEDGTVVDRFQRLVNPQRSIPGRITKLTGITTGMVFDAPTIDEVLPAYRCRTRPSARSGSPGGSSRASTRRASAG
jgi:DNA polymerase-3 subunit epsilon